MRCRFRCPLEVRLNVVPRTKQPGFQGGHKRVPADEHETARAAALLDDDRGCTVDQGLLGHSVKVTRGLVYIGAGLAASSQLVWGGVAWPSGSIEVNLASADDLGILTSSMFEFSLRVLFFSLSSLRSEVLGLEKMKKIRFLHR